MDQVNQYTDQFAFRLQRVTVMVWYTLRNPQVTVSFMAILAGMLLLFLLVPQRSALDVAAEAWTTTLPIWIQPWGDLLFFLGFSRILHSIWFWLPVGLLALSSVISLVDYGILAWRRASEPIAALEWQHPLAQRIEQSVRLPASPDRYLDELKGRLEAQGFSIYEPDGDDSQRLVSGSRQPWAWLAVIGFYSGLILLCGGFLVSHYSLKEERVTLFPQESKASQLFPGAFELQAVDSGRNLATVNYIQRDAEAGQVFNWRLYQPALLGDAVILPMAMEPVITVEAQDKTGALKRLIPVQVELAPADRLNLPVETEDTPLYFIIPSVSLAFQITPISLLTENSYNVQVRRGSEATPSENVMMRLGDPFEIDDLSIAVGLSYNLQFIARRDWALPLYAVSFVAIIGSVLVLFLRPPWHIWLIPEVKGRGGQLYSVVEKFGRFQPKPQFLEQLLASETSEEDPAT